LPSHLITTEDKTINLSPKFTFAEGAALPIAFFTVHQCLNFIGNLKAGETIIIHTATGAVGLVAIQMAQSIGAKVIATAGRKSKRNYLKSQGVQNVFSSRNLDFEKGVLDATGGKGVNMVC
jgi:NADPH:quinone reductase-like Zn-dependent oxidoreductase